MNGQKFALLMTASVMALALPTMGWAADGDDQTSDKAIGELVITGTLRTTRLQDVPLAVTAISGDTFEKSGFKELKELTFLSPSIQISQGANGIFIRGSGTNSQNAGTEQSVGMVIDGVLMGFTDDIGGDVSDLDHIEVYRGPQGTQFAKNASAGVVSVSTKKPVIGLSTFDVHATYGQHADQNDNVRMNIPINDTMAMRVVGSFQHRDGVFYNAARNDMQGLREQVGLKTKFLWQPKDDTSVYISADYRREVQAPNFPQAWRTCGPGTTTTYVTVFGGKFLPPCVGALTVGIVPSLTNATIGEFDNALRRTKAGGTSVQVTWPVGSLTATSISAFRFMDRDFFGPSGSGTFSSQFLDNRYDGQQYSQEFRLASPGDQKLTYVGGVFLYDRETELTPTRRGSLTARSSSTRRAQTPWDAQPPRSARAFSSRATAAPSSAITATRAPPSSPTVPTTSPASCSSIWARA